MSQSFVANGIITFSSDFGLQDPFVGVVKGVILRRFPVARIVDLCHLNQPYWPDEAGFWLSRSYGYFPAGSVHVAVVDPGVGTSRAIILLEACGQVFLAPDNGLLAPVVRSCVALGEPVRMYQLAQAQLAHFGITNVSATFHARDMFAPIAAEIASGRCHPVDFGTPCNTLAPDQLGVPVVSADAVSGKIVTIDHFGNLITNIEGCMLQRFSRPSVQLGARHFAVRRTYAEGAVGACVALVNAFALVEIACVQGHAATVLQAGRADPVKILDKIDLIC